MDLSEQEISALCLKSVALGYMVHTKSELEFKAALIDVLEEWKKTLHKINIL